MRRTLLTATALSVMAGMEAISQSMPAPRKGSNRDYRDADIERAFARNERPAPGPEEVKRAAVRAEIAAHNAEVERRKAEKRARRLTR